MGCLCHPGVFLACPHFCGNLLAKGYDFLPRLPPQILEFSKSQPSSTFCSLNEAIFILGQWRCQCYLLSLCLCWHQVHGSSLNIPEVWGLRLCEINHTPHWFSNLKGKRNLRIPRMKASFPRVNSACYIFLIIYFPSLLSKRIFPVCCLIGKWP